MGNCSFDIAKYALGKLCRNGHDWNSTGKSLRYLTTNSQRCIQCTSEKTKRQKEKDPEKVAYYIKQWHQRHPEKCAESSKRCRERKIEQYRERERRYREGNREEIAIRINKWRKENRERVLELQRKDRIKNPERETERGKRYRKLHAEECAIRRKKWREKNPEKVKIYKHERRARKLAVHTVPYTPDQVKYLVATFNSCCAYCGIKSERLSIDHFIPLSKGGTETISNLVPACIQCNSSKHNYDAKEWYKKQSFYSYKRWRKILKVLHRTEHNLNQLPLF